MLRDVTARPQSEPLAVVVGNNCRRIRTQAGMTQGELARHARSVGLDWSETRVGHFEAARSVPTFATVLALTLALQRAVEEARQRGAQTVTDVGLSDLVQVRGGYIGLNEQLDVTGAWLKDICAGGDASDPHPQDVRYRPNVTELPKGVADVIRLSGLTEERLARRLGVTREQLAAASFRLWQKSFSAERDRRAGPDANQQKKGRVARELRDEIEKAITSGEH